MRLSTRTKQQPSAVTAILGVGDFFGELCLAGYPLRMSTAVALTASSIRTIQKKKMLQMLRKKNKASNALVAYLLSSVQKYKDHVSELLTSSAEQRLARVLLRLAHLDKRGPAVVEIPSPKPPSSGGNGRHHPPASQSIHESIQEAGIHKLRWGIRSAPVVAESSAEPLGSTLGFSQRAHEPLALLWDSGRTEGRNPNTPVARGTTRRPGCPDAASPRK